MSIELKNIFSKKLTKYTGLLLILIFVLVIFLLNMDSIMGYLGNKKHISTHNNEKFNNIGYEGHDTSNTSGYLSVDNNIIEGFEDPQDPPDPQASQEPETVMEDLNRNYKIIIDPKKKNVNVNFKAVEQGEIKSGNTIKGYLLVLAKYNSSLEQVGHINAKLTNETQDYTKHIEKLYANGIITEGAKGKLLSGDLSSFTATKIAGKFENTDDDKLLNNIDSLTIGDTTYPANERQQEFLKLLELVYNDKYYNKALRVESDSYNTGIASLYNDFKTLFSSSVQFPPTTNFKTSTANTEIINEDNASDQRKIIISANKKDAETISTEVSKLSATYMPDIALKFLNIFLDKYSNLSDDTGKYNKSGICNVDGQCNYVFENLEDKDSAGNFYYYKLGIGMIYISSSGTSMQENISNIYTYKFGTGGRLTYFKLDNSLEEQERLLNRLEEIEQNSILSGKKNPIQPMIDDVNVNPMDAYMKMLEPHIGNYPDEFTLREQDVKDLSLSDYLNKSLSRGTINVDVDIKDLIITNDNVDNE